MSVQDKAKRLFDYIADVYAVDLPANRSVLDYKDGLWWPANWTPCDSCRIKRTVSDNPDAEDEPFATDDGAWLSVYKRTYEAPPALPDSLTDWCVPSNSPIQAPSPAPSRIQVIKFEDEQARKDALKQFRIERAQRKADGVQELPPLPVSLTDWVHPASDNDQGFTVDETHEIEELFDSDPVRVIELEDYTQGPWRQWAERVMPYFRANKLYDEFYNVRQILSVENDRLELVWGHAFLSWRHERFGKIYHPLILTPLNLEFDPVNRNIRLVPSETVGPRFDLECLRDVDYPHKDEVLKYARLLNEGDSSIDPWNFTQVSMFASRISGYLSADAQEESNQYHESATQSPETKGSPVIFNAPALFLRKRSIQRWIEDAKSIAQTIQDGAQLSPFITSLLADAAPGGHTGESTGSSSDAGDQQEILFPLEYNAQQKEICQKLANQVGVLVQGPPGTGKSHSIANIISHLLAQGKRVLVTSQTENALKVLRNLIPEDIRPLCVSHLGNDAQSKTHLSQAVTAIGGRLAKRNSTRPVTAIETINRDLTANRQEQARVYHQIQAWAELDSSKIQIGDTEISAYAAAVECAEQQSQNGWFPDQLHWQTEPPLSSQDLETLANLLSTIGTDDRESCRQSLPEIDALLSPGALKTALADLTAFNATAEEFEEIWTNWKWKESERLAQGLAEATDYFEEALEKLAAIEATWQQTLLELIVSDPEQLRFWSDFLDACAKHRELAWQAFQSMQGYVFNDAALPEAFDRETAIQQLRTFLAAGKNPTSWISRIQLPKLAKQLFDTVRIDGKAITSLEKLDLLAAKQTYEEQLTKFETRWDQTIGMVGGPCKETSAMALVDVGNRLKQVQAAIGWRHQYHDRLNQLIEELGAPPQQLPLHQAESLALYIKAFQGKSAALQAQRVKSVLRDFKQQLLNTEADRHPIYERLMSALERKDVDDYATLHEELSRLTTLKPKVRQLSELLDRLAAAAPKWASEFAQSASGADFAIPADWQEAWRWSRLNSWLQTLHDRESVEQLQFKLANLRAKERALLQQLVAEQTWHRQIQNVKGDEYRALTAWEVAMKNYGTGKGKYAPRYLADARKAMEKARGAVPVWVMPLNKVVESFPPLPGLFDVIIVDEASQCELRGLNVLFRGKKILVVGDPEQISPSNVGIGREKVFELIRQHLGDIPYADSTFTIDNSLYHITSRFVERILLTEHFRCLPSIIEFNNRLCPTYGGNLEPLRQPHPTHALEPAIQTILVETGYKKDNDTNEAEAKALVEQLVTCCKDSRYATGGKDGGKRTFGIISLLGNNQAKLISNLLASHPALDETEREDRKIICGDAYAFQGDERDVMFLSMVVAPNAQFQSLTSDKDRQRFNVATSRARDQVFLFHSVRLTDLKNENCMRYKLLSWYQNPPQAELDAGLKALQDKHESPFELAVGEQILARGYQIIPQFVPFPRDRQYRIDLVVQGENNRVAVECDGDRWHGPDQWEYDQRREEQLRRAGWKFWRISGSSFYRNKEKSLQDLWRFLEECGIRPKVTGATQHEPSVPDDIATGQTHAPTNSKPEQPSKTPKRKAPPRQLPIDLGVTTEPGTENVKRTPRALGTNGNGGAAESGRSRPNGSKLEITIKNAHLIDKGVYEDLIVQLLLASSNHSSIREDVPGKLLKELKIVTRGKPREDFERMIDKVMSRMEKKEIIETYKATNTRVRLTKLFLNKHQ